MENLFTKEETGITSKKLKNGKCPGIENMNAEYIKYTPGTTHKIIADVLRKSVGTDDYLEILKEGILTPLRQPSNKTKNGENKTNSLRPVLMLPSVWKVFAICVIERTRGKLKNHIPKD